MHLTNKAAAHLQLTVRRLVVSKEQLPDPATRQGNLNFCTF